MANEVVYAVADGFVHEAAVPLKLGVGTAVDEVAPPVVYPNAEGLHVSEITHQPKTCRLHGRRWGKGIGKEEVVGRYVTGAVTVKVWVNTESQSSKLTL